ncbi:hypothetical protein PMKS-000846 [Pichia membranifaciens]|uniref:Rho-GAP domain-containing protein n=1 Tax=Pichia membranifaciens TaxID=4926 RepID=A0A1Q2YCW3_9ASCO|nr:hypothetical protein PMKS-000846 [Pichia membranifaciens]
MEKKKKYEKMKKLKKAREETLANKKEQSKFDDIPKLGNGGKDDITLEISLKGAESKNNSSTPFDPTKSEKKEVASVQKMLSPQPIKASITQPESNLLKSDDKPKILSKPPTYQREANSSISTFDVDDYAESSNDAKDELGSSLYSKTNDANSSRDSDIKNSLAGSIEKIDSSPIEKLDVVLDYNITSPNTEKLQSTAVFKDVTEPVNIPTLSPNPQNDDGFSYLYQEHHESDISIPMRSPKRSALSPVRNTTQFRTPELDTPQKKKPTPKEISSPSSMNRHGFVIENDDLEPEPESFINLEETEEESLMSTTESTSTANQLEADVKDSKLMSPMKYKVKSHDVLHESTGLNIKGLESKNVSEIISSKPKKAVINRSPHERLISTPEQQSQSSFESIERNTPNSRKKQIGGLGRSLTKVFGRGRKYSNDGREIPPQTPETPDTLTSSRTSPRLNNTTPKAHTRTQSDHSYVAFTTPPVPLTKTNHTRSISESTTFDAVDQVSGVEKELRLLKSEINSLTLSKATIIRDIQTLASQMKSLELDIADRQKVLRDLDISIQNRRKLSSATTEELSSNMSSSSGKNSSKEELSGYKISSQENLMQPDSHPLSSSLGQQSLQPGTGSSVSTPGYNPYHQSTAPTSQSKDKRSGFMRRIFGAHSALSSAGTGSQTTGASAPSSSASNKVMGAPNISQPMNVRHNENSMDGIGLNDLGKKNDNGSQNSGMKPSRSTNFMQWRTNGGSNGSNNVSNNSSANGVVYVNGGSSTGEYNGTVIPQNNINFKSLYSMTLQELADHEGGSGVPFVVKTCISEVEKRGSKVEGIYRISASTSTVEKIEQFFETMDVNNSDEIIRMHTLIDGDIHALAGLLKRYLKKIPDPIIPQDLYNAYVNVSRIDKEETRVGKLSEIISSLPAANRITLLALTKHLALISENEKWTKMNSASLATVFAPTLIRHNSLHPQQEIQDNRAKTSVTELLFKHYDDIFHS